MHGFRCTLAVLACMEHIGMCTHYLTFFQQEIESVFPPPCTWVNLCDYLNEPNVDKVTLTFKARFGNTLKLLSVSVEVL